MGGYNTICEILTHGIPALIIPRETPRQEQLIRATCLNKLNLLDFLPWGEVNPLILRDKIFSLINTREKYVKAVAAFKLSGLDVIQTRIEFFKKQSEKVTVMPQYTENTLSSLQGMVI
jgi:predicted glycosyltransferase